LARVVWSNKALGEVESITAELLKSSPQYALALAESLILSTDVLETFPRLGRVVPEDDEARHRELIVESYRVVYEVQGETVSVTTVLHGKRNIGAILRGLRRRRGP
jgi:plasmid stabilization system protein ParE